MNSINPKLIEKTIDKLDEVMNDLTREKQHSLLEICTALKNTSDKEGDLELKQSLLILSNICSLILNLRNKDNPFEPLITIAKNNEHTFFPIDLKDHELIFLPSIVSKINYPLIKSRIADVLWTCLNPRKREHAETAIKNYISLNIDNDSSGFRIYDFWERAVILAKQIKNIDLIKKLKSKLIAEIENEKIEWDFHLLRVVEIFYNTDLDKNLFPKLADKLLEKQKNFNHNEQFNVVEKYLQLANKLSCKNDKKYEISNILAQATENYGDYRKSESNMVANYLYKRALQIYKEISLSYRENFQLTNKLDLLQKKITQSGKLILDELQFLSINKVDFSKLVDQSISHVKGKNTPFETILYFSGVCHYDFENILKQAEEVVNNYIIYLFKTTSVSLDGRKISEIPPLNYDNKNEIIFKVAIKNFPIYMNLSTNGCIIPALEQIKNEHIFSRELLIKLCKCSPMVPEKREILVSNALYHGFEGDFGTAIYLLAPQVENMIRQLLKQNGIVTTHTDKNGIEHEMGLSSLVNIKGVREILRDDLWFELQAVFTDSLSANLRNEVRHGLLDDEASNSLYSVYAWWMILRLIVRSALLSPEQNK